MRGRAIAVLTLVATGSLGPTCAKKAHPAAWVDRESIASGSGNASTSTRSAWSIATTMKSPPIDQPRGIAHVVARVPEGFDAHAPLHLILYFHGANACVVQEVMDGEVVCRDGEQTVTGPRLGASHDDAATQSIFVAPQFGFRGAVSAGRTLLPGYFKSFVEEIVSSTVAPAIGEHHLDEVASITLIGHSAGWAPITAILLRGDLADKVQNVVILDSPFGDGWDTYAAWVARGTPKSPHKFVSVYGPWGDTHGSNARFLRKVRAQKTTRTIEVDPEGSLTEAIRRNDVVVTKTPVGHHWMPHMLLTKVIEGLPLPRRIVDEEPPLVTPPKSPLVREVDVEGLLEGNDGRRANGSLFDDYSLPLAKGETVTLTARGERSINEACCELDMELQVLLDEKILARDDDSAGGMASRLVFTADTEGSYVVRVTTSGSFYRAGAYVLRVTPGSN